MVKSSSIVVALAIAMVSAGCNAASELVSVDVGLTSAGGDFTFGDVTVHVPANAVTTAHKVNIAAATGSPSSNRLVGVPVTVTMTPPDSLLQPATIEVHYSSLTIPARIGKGSIRVYRAVGGKWVSLGGSNNTSTSVVTAQTSNFSDFGLLGLRAETVQTLSATSQAATPNTAIAAPPSIKVLDSTGAALADIPVVFAVSTGGGSILPASVATNASGIATATSWTAGSGAGVTNTATAKAADLTAVSFNATTPGGSTGVIAWFSDFRNGTGQGTPAISDGGKWGSTQGAGLSTQFSVVASTGLNFPMTNVGKVNYDGNSNKNFQLVSELSSNSNTVPAVGQYWYLRFYYRNDVPNGQDLGEAHWLQAHDITSWEFKHGMPAGGTYPFRIVLDASGALSFDSNNFLVDLTTGTTYIVELQIHRLTSSTGKMVIRVSNTSGTLLFDNNTFHTFNGNSDTMAGRDPTMPVNDNAFIDFDMGNNDPDRTGVGSFYVSGFATRVSPSATDWIGAYTTGG